MGDPLETVVARLALAVIKIQEDVAESHKSRASTEDLRRVREMLSDFSAQLLNYERETSTFPVLLDEHGKALKDHSKRISALENPK